MLNFEKYEILRKQVTFPSSAEITETVRQRLALSHTYGSTMKELETHLFQEEDLKAEKQRLKYRENLTKVIHEFKKDLEDFFKVKASEKSDILFKIIWKRNESKDYQYRYKDAFYEYSQFVVLLK